MQIETSSVEKPYEKPEGERRGIAIANTGDGKGKHRSLRSGVARMAAAKRSRYFNS